jgi:hypothetical protein
LTPGYLPGWYEKIFFIIFHQTESLTSLAFHPAEAIIQAAIFLIIILTSYSPCCFFSFCFIWFHECALTFGFSNFSFENRINKWTGGTILPNSTTNITSMQKATMDYILLSGINYKMAVDKF